MKPVSVGRSFRSLSDDTDHDHCLVVIPGTLMSCGDAKKFAVLT